MPAEGEFPYLNLDTDQEDRTLPLSNGTLTVSPDGAHIVATDADRDEIYVISTSSPPVLRKVSLERGAAPGRVVASNSVAYATSRRRGRVLVTELATGNVRTYPVCASPQGLAIESEGVLHVACRSGQLLSLRADTGEVIRELTLSDDLRDLSVSNDGLVVSRFRSAELLWLDKNGVEKKRLKPKRILSQAPGVAWRTIRLPDNTFLMAHQMMTTSEVSGFAGATGTYRGTCGGISAPTLSVISGEAVAEPALISDDPFDPMAAHTLWQSTLPGIAGTIDVATFDGKTVLVATPGNALESGAPVNLEDRERQVSSSLSQVVDPIPSTCGGWTVTPETGLIVSMAFLPNGARVVQKRVPPEVEIDGLGSVRLAETSLHNAGFSLFQMSTPLGIACASCHPEGRDDGHTWAFSSVGFRRTPSMEAGAEAPFHWSGDLPSLHSLVDEVLARRMGLKVQFTEAQVSQLSDFLNTIPASTGFYPGVADAVERGRLIFESEDAECATCHHGSRLTDNSLHDVGTGGTFVTPSLISLASRAPYMHDGCGQTLEERLGPCGGSRHGKVDHLTSEEKDDLIAFLRSL